MSGERIILYDNSPAKPSPYDGDMVKVTAVLSSVGLSSLLSYWLMNEVYIVWHQPLVHIGYTIFITVAFVVLHAAILAAAIWIVLAVAGLVARAVRILSLPFVFLWRVTVAVVEALRVPGSRLRSKFSKE